MDLYQSPRIGRLKQTPYLTGVNYFEKIIPIHTPKTLRQVPRAVSLIETKKATKSIMFGTQKTSKNIKKLDSPLDTFSRIKKTSVAKNTIVNFINETKNIETQSIKSENLSLKNNLNQINLQFAEQSEKYEQKVLEYESETKHLKTEYLKLLHFFLQNFDLSNQVQQNLEEKVQEAKVLEPSEIEEFFKEVKKESQEKNPFVLDQSVNSTLMTARFQSMNEAQIHEIFHGCSEVIILEDFQCQQEGFISVRAGDRVKIIKKIDEEWWLGSFNSEIGKFPVKSVLID